MQGKNDIVINQATMIEAIQMYFDSQFAEGKSPKIDSVEKSGIETGTSCECFLIRTIERESK